MIVLPHSSPNDFHNSFNNNTRSPDLTNPSITNYSSIAPSIPSSMYQTTQQSFVYTPSTNNNNLTNQQQQHFVVAAAHSRSPSTSTISRNSPADTASFAIDSGSFYRYDTTNNINGDSRSSPVQQSQALISNTMSSTPADNNGNNTTATTTTNSIGVNVLPPISEVLQQQQSSQQQQQQQQQQSSSPSTPVSSSPTQSQMVPNIQVQTQTSTNGIPISMTAPTGQSVSAGFYQYSDVNAAYTSTQADQNFATQSSLQQAMNQQAAAAAAAAALSQQHHHQAAQQQQQALSQQALDQNTSNGMVVDPRTLPPIVGTTASDMQLMDATAAHRRSSILAINTAGIPVHGTEASPISANSSTGSPILSTGPGTTTITYHSPDAAAAAAQQALFTNLMANNVIMQAPQRTVNTTTTGRRRSDTIIGNDPAAQVTMNSQPPKVYSFVPLPGINTKKRPRRRYDEIERHYSCEWPGCTKAYGTLNHLNAHVQMQKHGPKRHPSEFKELRKQWRRQKREEEERKAAEVQAKQNAALLNSNLTSI